MKRERDRQTEKTDKDTCRQRQTDRQAETERQTERIEMS